MKKLIFISFFLTACASNDYVADQTVCEVPTCNILAIHDHMYIQD